MEVIADDFVSRSRSARKLKWNTFRNLSCETEANKFPLETWSGVSLFYCRFSLSIVVIRFRRYYLPFLHALTKDGFIFNEILVKSIYFRFDENRETDSGRSTDCKISPAKRHQRLKHLSNRISPAAVPQDISGDREKARECRTAPHPLECRGELAGWSCIQYLLPFTLLIMPVDRSCRREYPGSEEGKTTWLYEGNG